MRTALFVVPIVVTWLALGYKLRDLYRDPRNVVLRYFCVVVASIGLTFTLGWPPVTWRLEHYSGVLAIWVTGTSVIGCAFVQLTLLLWAYPPDRAWPRIRARMPLYGLAFAVMLALDLSARPTTAGLDVAAYAQIPETLWGRTPLVAESVLVFLVVLGYTSVEATRRFWRYARSVERPWLRRGLWLTGVGTMANLWYAVAGAVFILGLRAGVDLPPAQQAMMGTATLGVLIGAVGVTMPAWGPRLDRLRWYRRLHPLWYALSRAAPEVVLDPHTSRRAHRWPVRDLDFRLYRRVIEIRDSRLALRPFLDERVSATARELGRAAGLDGVDLAATVEAATLAAALRVKQRNRSAGDGAGGPGGAGGAGGPGGPGAVVAGGHDLTDEVAWLTAVARAFAGSPVVVETLARTDAPEGATA